MEVGAREIPTSAHESQAGESHAWDLASVALLTAVAFVMLATFRDYGFTYDEPPHIRYGDRILALYSSGLAQRQGVIMSYVGGFDLLAAVVRRISPLDALQTNHLVCVFVAQCGLIGTWKLGRSLGGGLTGFCSVLFLLLVPVYYGHQFNNPKDVPFAAGYVWGLYYIAQWLERHYPSLQPSTPTPVPLSFFVRLGLAIGAGMAVRVGGVLLIGYLALFTALTLLERKRLGATPQWPQLKPLLARLAVALGIGWSLMLALWPKALLSPLKGPVEAVNKVSRFQTFDSPTLFRGKMLSSHDVPWDYLPTYFLQQLPEFLIACLVGSVGWLAVQSYQALKGRLPLRLSWWLLVTATFLPPTYAAVRHSVLYDGLRHFLFLMPPIAVLGALGFRTLLNYLQRRSLGWVAFTCLSVFALDQTYALVRLHPHQHVFFNRASGGTKVAAKRYETEYYGSVYRELNRKLALHLWQQYPEKYLNTTVAVAGCGSKLFFTENLPLNFRYTSMSRVKHADLFATYARDRCLERLKEYPELLRVARDGATLGVVRSLNKAWSPSRKKTPRSRDE